MPYFKCERCALRLYSAASKTQCTECGAPLGSTERMLDAIPLARPRRSRRHGRPFVQPLAVNEWNSG